MTEWTFDWDRWYRVPPELPSVRELPEPPPGAMHLLHHANNRTVAVYDPRRGRTKPAYELLDPEFMLEPRVQGRYLPLRSGILAFYRDAAGRAVVQHRRRRLVLPEGARLRLRWFYALRTLAVEGGETLRVVDMGGRWEGPLLLRLWDFTWTEPDDFDLLLAIVRSTNGETAAWI